jgi:surface protein
MPIRYGSGPARQNSTPNICITKWDTSIAGGTATGVKVPLVNQTSNEYRLTIDWGDGTKENLQNRSGIPLQHTYDETGIYTIRMVGTILGWDNSNFNNQDDAKLIEIVNWGPLTLKNDSSFFGSTNLTYISADDYPNFRFLSAFEGAGTKSMFANCSNLTGIKNLASWTPSAWDINGDMSSMFGGCTNFNDSGLLAWDYSNITSMPGLLGTAWTHSWSGVDLSSVTTLGFPSNYFQTYTLEGHLLGTFYGIFKNQTLSGIADMGHVEAWNNLPNLTDVTNASQLFNNADFNGTDWPTGLDLSNIETGDDMFIYSKNLNLDMSIFDLTNLKNADSMFRLLPITSQPSINLNSTGLENIRFFLNRCYYFTGSVDIDTSNVTDMDRVFERCYDFNHPSVTGWNTSNVTDMFRMFYQAEEFNQDISNWDVSNVTDMSDMFEGCQQFNQPIGSWDVGKVQSMSYMLFDIINISSVAQFDQDIGAWRMSGLVGSSCCDFLIGTSFTNGIFNNGGSPSISGWVFGNATSLNGMFYNQVLFNQPIGPWDTSKITNINQTLYNCDSFDQDLSNWVVTGITDAGSFMQIANGLSTTNYDHTLSGWAQQSGDLQSGVSIHFGNSKYSVATGEQYRNILTGVGWTITDGGSV